MIRPSASQQSSQQSSQQGIDACGQTDRGLVRPANEDHFLIGQLDKSLLVTSTSLAIGSPHRVIGAPEGQVFCVADGLGGHAAGEHASSSAVDTTMHYLLHTMPCFFRAQHLCEQELHGELTAAVEHAQTEIGRLAAADATMRGMGTTLTLAFVQWPWLHLVHVGDSRCYLLRDELKQLSTDHTLMQQLIDDGTVEADAAPSSSPLRHALWNAIGDKAAKVHVELAKHELQGGDTILLCTDGLTEHVSDAAIREILRSAASAAEATKLLTDAANAGGGSDNITVVVARIPSVLEAERPEAMRLADDPPDLTRLDQ